MKRLAIVLLLVVGCGTETPAALCVTRCGLSYQGRVTTRAADYTCEEIQRTEDRLIVEIAAQYPAACTALRGWDLWSHATPSWVDYWGRSVAGLTNCKNFQSEIGLAAIGSSALAHEMTHMVQSCYGGSAPLDPGMDGYHGDWVRRGLFALIDTVNAESVPQVQP